MAKEVVYLVKTRYTSGQSRLESIVAESEDKMWDNWRKHHNEKLVYSATIENVAPFR